MESDFLELLEAVTRKDRRIVVSIGYGAIAGWSIIVAFRRYGNTHSELSSFEGEIRKAVFAEAYAWLHKYAMENYGGY